MSNPSAPSIRVAVDIGGTFTDLAAVDTRTGERWFAKSSTTPDNPTRGIANCLAKLGKPGGEFEIFVHGTTLVINARKVDVSWGSVKDLPLKIEIANRLIELPENSKIKIIDVTEPSSPIVR